jgi:hypothetical protein
MDSIFQPRTSSYTKELEGLIWIGSIVEGSEPIPGTFYQWKDKKTGNE